MKINDLQGAKDIKYCDIIDFIIISSFIKQDLVRII